MRKWMYSYVLLLVLVLFCYPVLANDLNGTDTGRLFIADDGRYMDLTTGNYFALTPDNIDTSISPSANGLEFVETREDCRYISNSFTDIDCVNIRNLGTGLIADSFEVYNSIIGPAKLSSDGSRIAAIWRNEYIGEGHGDEKLTIFSRTGVMLSRSSHVDVNSFDWLPNGMLIYAAGQTVYRTTVPGQATGSAIRTFTASAGVPSYLNVNPAGTIIAFELITGGGSHAIKWRNSKLWLMNVDGSGWRLLATSADTDPKVNSPVWSPSGATVLAVEGHISGLVWVPDPFDPGDVIPTPIGTAGALFSIPTSLSDVILPPSNNSVVRPVLEAKNNGRARFATPGIGGYFEWLAAAALPAEIRGSLPNNTGTNHGLAGTIYFDDDGVGDTTALHGLRLEAGTDTNKFKLTDDDLDNVRDIVHVSDNEKFISHYIDDGSDSAIWIYDHLGNRLKGISLDTNSYDVRVRGGPVRFSPVNTNHILFPYRDYGESSKGNVAVIDWSQMRFVKTFTTTEYVGVDWTPAGDIVLAAKDGSVYRAARSGETYASPTKLFARKDPAYDITVSPSGQHLAMILAGRVWVSGMSGQGLRRITWLSEDFEAFPEWSPDGKYIAFKSIDSDDNAMDLGRIWVVAAGARDIRLRKHTSTPHAIPVKNNSGEHLRIFGAFSWRLQFKVPPKPIQPNRNAGLPWLMLLLKE